MLTNDDDRGVKASIFSLISKELMIPAEQLTLATDFKKDLGVDSLQVIEFALAFEDRFGILIPNAALETFRTIGDVVAYIEESHARGEQPPAR